METMAGAVFCLRRYAGSSSRRSEGNGLMSKGLWEVVEIVL